MGAINIGGGNSKDSHKHENMEVLKELNEKNGNLTYKGKEIFGGSDSGILATQVIETEDRKFLSKKEKESLSGIKDNIQSQIDIIKVIAEERIRFRGRFNSYSDLTNTILDPAECDMAFIDNDETQDNVSTIYYYTNKKWLRIKKDSAGGNNGWIASNIAPTNKNLLWIDVSTADPILKYFNGSAWVDISGLKEVPAKKVIQEKDLRFVSDKSDAILNKMEEDSDTGLLMYNGLIIGTGNSGSGANIDDTNISIDSTFSSFKINTLLKGKQNQLDYIPEDSTKKGKANGYTPLNGNGKVDKDFLTLFNFSVADIAARDLIESPEHGSTCYIESTTELFVYTIQNEWILVSKGNSINISKYNYNGTRNPVYDDDSSEGYSIGSIWINTLTKKAFICTNAEIGKAVWELMAGAVTLNIGEIIPFKLDPIAYTEENGKYKYEVPKMNLETDYMELTVNGHEAIKDTHYTISEDETKTYIILEELLTDKDYIFGEIYKHDIKKAEQQMLKSVYDSNDNGKVDLAEISDKAKGFLTWTPETRYELGEFILKDGALYSPVIAHTSGLVYENDKWTMLKANPFDLSNFTTDNLEPTTQRTYVTESQLTDIKTIPNLTNRVSQNEKNIGINKANITTLTTEKDALKNRLDNLRFINLVDTPSTLTPNSFFKVNQKGTAIVSDANPLFPIKKIIDSSNTVFNSVDTLKLTNMKMENQTQDGIFTFSLDANTFNLSDMPKKHEHGKVLVSDLNNNKYVLADKEELTMSIENFSCKILEADWIEANGRFEKEVYHDMSSVNLIVSFTDSLLLEDKTISYQILDNKNIKVISNSRKDINCVINCALGAGNGYWQYLMDWSKIDFVDDSKIRTDRAHSSAKITEMLKSYALKNDYYTKLVSDTRYAIKSLEHDHLNKKTLDQFSVDTNGDVQFNNKRLLTEMNPLNISLELISNNEELTELYDMKTICTQNNLQAIIASEILVQNTSESEAIFQVRDGNFTLVTIALQPNEVQKYHLGISNKIKVFGKGKTSTMLTISAF